MNLDTLSNHDSMRQSRWIRRGLTFRLSRTSRSIRDKAQSELAAAQQASTKLTETLPHYQKQAEAFAELAQDGYVSRFEAADKQREYTERSQDLKTQQHLIASAQATLTASSRKLEQISADYRQRLQAERADLGSKLDKTQAEYAKQQYRHELLELKAPQDGIIKDVATHTIAVKGLADTAKQLVSVYAQQQAQLAKLAKRVEELEKAGNK